MIARILKRGMALVELLIDDNCKTPQVSTISGGVRVRIPTAITYDEIMNTIGTELTAVQAIIVFDLWCNDDVLRHFMPTKEGVMVTLRENRTNGSQGSGSSASGRPLLAR